MDRMRARMRASPPVCAVHRACEMRFGGGELATTAHGYPSSVALPFEEQRRCDEHGKCSERHRRWTPHPDVALRCATDDWLQPNYRLTRASPAGSVYLELYANQARQARF